MTRACKHRPLELSFWLAIMDLTCRRGLLGVALYPVWSWAFDRAVECTEWGDGADCSGGTGEEPF